MNFWDPFFLKQRTDRAIAALNEFSVDAWVMIGRETHYTPEPAMSYLLPACVLPTTALVITKAGESICLIGSLDAEEVEAYGVCTTVERVVEGFEPQLTAILARIPKGGTIAINHSEVDPSSDGLSYTQYLKLMRCLKAAGFTGTLAPASNIMKRVRAQKSPEEVQGIERTVQASMKIYEASRTFIKPGLSGMDIQRFFQDRVHDMEAEFSWPKLGNPFVSVGARSSYLCKRPPADILLTAGDLVNVDFGLRIDGFASDNQRSYYVLASGETKACSAVQSAFEAVQAGIRAAVAAAGPGIYTTVPRDAANVVFESLGYPKVGGLGHEVGTFAHEGGMGMGRDFLIPEMDCHLETGMTFTMEPAILTPNGRLCQEEVVTITNTGARMLSTPQEAVWLV